MDEDQNIPHPGQPLASNGFTDQSDKEIKRIPVAPVLQSLPGPTQNQKPKMKVHKHPHHVMHKKKWPEYLLEFIMIFLAVFLGFFAENVREHKVDKEIFVQQMGTALLTLTNDINDLGYNLWYNNKICKGLDSFRRQVDEAIAGRVDANKLYYYHWKYGKSWILTPPFISPLLQLQNSGMLRLIKNDSIIYQMLNYYERVYPSVITLRAEVVKRQDKLSETNNTIFDLQGFEELVTRDTGRRNMFSGIPTSLENYYNGIINRNPPLILLSTEPKDLKRLYMDLTLFEMEIHRINAWTRSAIYFARYLRNMILKEYNLNTGKITATYSSVGIAGSATGKGWETSIPMQQKASDRHEWQDTLTLSAGEVKFRVDNNWKVNWGETFFPTGIAYQDGPDIPIPMAATYAVTFNDLTGDYSFTVVSPESR